MNTESSGAPEPARQETSESSGAPGPAQQETQEPGGAPEPARQENSESSGAPEAARQESSEAGGAQGPAQQETHESSGAPPLAQPETNPESKAPEASDGENRKATYADLETVPFDHVAELVEGQLYVSPHPGATHMVTATELFGELGGPFSKGRGGPGGWRLMFEPELHLGEDVLVPDLGGWLRERMPRPTGGETLRLAPDWLCEVRTATSRALDWETKLRLYARAGVRHVWRADPETRTLEVLRLEGTSYQLLATHQGENRVRAEPFEAIELDLGLIWDE